jgi:hypothetical protein
MRALQEITPGSREATCSLELSVSCAQQVGGVFPERSRRKLTADQLKKSGNRTGAFAISTSHYAAAVVVLYVIRLVPVVMAWQTLAAIAESGGQRVIQ